MSYMVTVVAYAVVGFIVLFFMSAWVFRDLTIDLLSGLLGAVVGAALVLIPGKEQVRKWLW